MYGIQPADSAIMSAREPCRTSPGSIVSMPTHKKWRLMLTSVHDSGRWVLNRCYGPEKHTSQSTNSFSLGRKGSDHT